MPVHVDNLVMRAGMFYCNSTPHNWHSCEAEMHLTPKAPHTLYPECICHPELFLVHGHAGSTLRIYEHHRIP